MYKDIKFGSESRQKILNGVNITAKAVKSTLGPKGQNVIFEESSYPTITKDGVTVAQQIFLEDKFENMGNMLAREAAENTNREAGDGTTTTVALLESMVNEANQYIIAKMNPILIKRGMDEALKAIILQLDNQVKEIKTDKEKLQIATISANNDPEIGKMIHEVIKKTGKDGVVTVQNSNSDKTEVEYVKGTKVSSGYESHIFINDRKRLTVNLENPAIVITTENLTDQNQLIPLLESLVNSGKRDVILFCNNIESTALAFLIQNKLLGKFNCVPVRMSSFGDYQKELMYDIAALTKATVIGEDDAVFLKNATVEQTGTCEHVIISRDDTILSGGKGNIKDRIDSIKTMLKDEKDLFIVSKLQERLGKLTGSIANIKVGGASETEQVEIKYRIEDALNATKSAIEDGIVEGGGVALLKCSKFEIEDSTKEFTAGVQIVMNALKVPLETIVSNGGENGGAVAAKVLDGKKGYNALTGEYVDLFKAGIIDPLKVVKNEIKNSVATAGTLITAGCSITNKPDKKE